MKKIILLVVVALFFSCNQKTQTVNSDENTTKQSQTNTKITFRDYEWGTPMSVVLEKEGEPYYTEIEIEKINKDFIFSGLSSPNFREFAATIKQLFDGLELPIADVLYHNVQAAGHEFTYMSFYFINDKLVMGEYDIVIGTSGEKEAVFTDLQNKLTLLYGDPRYLEEEQFANGKCIYAEWGSIYLEYSINSIQEGVLLTYISRDYFVEQLNQIKNNTTGL